MKGKISVCLAAYNGEKYILEQINSILPQLNDGDELLIVDDVSNDNTLDIIKSLNSSYIKIIKNDHNLGHVKTFEKLFYLANNEIIFMSDQDDIWQPNKINVYKEYFSAQKVLLISDNSEFINENGVKINADIIKLSGDTSMKYQTNINNIYKGTAGYYGCGMAMKKELLKIILPIPSYVESHDLWIAMVANMMRSNLHINKKTFFRRIHGKNDSLQKRKFSKKIYSRIVFLKSQLEISKRLKEYNKLKS